MEGKDHWMQHVKRCDLVRKSQKFSLDWVVWEGRLKHKCCHVTMVQDSEIKKSGGKDRKEKRRKKKEVGIGV
jgi:hypothetical protein